MKLAAWFVVAGIGVALMIGVYRSERDAGGVTPISSGMIVAVRSTQQTFDGPIPYPSIKAGVTHLPASGISAMLAMSASGSAERMRSLQFRISEKVIQSRSRRSASIKARSLGGSFACRRRRGARRCRCESSGANPCR